MTHVLDALGRIKEYWGSVALADLADYVRGVIIRGGAVDYEAYAAETLGAVLIGDGTDVISDTTPTLVGLLTLNAGALLAGGVLDADGVADAVVLDADGDTTISAPTDDQIDIEIAGADYGELIERVLGWDEVVDVGTWYDFKLTDATEGDHFRQNAATFPAGWVEADAASQTDTNSMFSFWYLVGHAAEVSWDYRKQTGIDIEGLAASQWASFQFGPILFRDGLFAADVNYYFSIHGETAAAIDLTEYVRVHLWWDSANSLWKVRGESDQGAGQTASGWTPLDIGPLHQPLYFRIVIRNNANKTTREYFSSIYKPIPQTLLQSVDETTTWGQVYWRIHQTRGAGIYDYLYVGAVDYLGAEA